MTRRENLDALQQLASNGVLSDRRIAREIAVGLDGFSKLWTEELLPFIEAGGADLRFIEGPYGRGKTHLLQHLTMLAENAGFLTCYTSCDGGGSPFESLQDTYRVVAKNIAGVINGESVVGLHNLVERIELDRLRKLSSHRHINPGFRNLALSYARRRQADSSPDPTTADLRSLLLGDQERRVLFAELFRRDRNLPRPLGKLGKRNASVWLRSLLSLAQALGLKGLAVFFDETGADFLAQRNSRRVRQQHMANLRNLIDHLAVGDVAGCIIIYAVTQDLIQRAREDYPALAQRIERPQPTGFFTTQPPNPRAVWSRLDDLTEPSRNSAAFYQALGKNLIELGRNGGCSEAKLRAAQTFASHRASEVCQFMQDDIVRLFVKEVSSQILM